METDKISLNKIIYLDNYKKPREEIDEEAVLEKVKDAVENGKYIENEYSETGKHAIMVACILKMQKVAIYLIENKVNDINAVSKEGLTPILFAINFELYRVVEKLLEHDIDLLQRENKNNLNAFAMACVKKNQELAVYIFNKMVKSVKDEAKIVEALYTPIFGGSITVFIIVCKIQLYYVAKTLINFQYSVNKITKEKRNREYDFLNIHFEDSQGYDCRYYFMMEINETMKNKLVAENAPQKNMDESLRVFDTLMFFLLTLYGNKPNKTYDVVTPDLPPFKSSMITMCVLNGMARSLEYVLNYATKEEVTMKSLYSKDAFLLLVEKFDEDWRTYNNIMALFIMFKDKLSWIDYEATDVDGNNALGLCFYGGYFEIILYLLENGHVSTRHIRETTIAEKNILFVGCDQLVKKYYVNRYNLDEMEFRRQFKCVLDIINFIVKKTPTFLKHTDHDGLSLLHYCAGIHGSLPIIKRILKNNPHININAKTPNFQTPLAIACITNNIPVALFLLKQPNIQYNTEHYIFVPILLACEYKKQDIALELLKFRDINLNVNDVNNLTPFLLACLHGMSNVALKMLEFPSDVVLGKNFYSITPYQLAAICGLTAVKEKMETMNLDKEIIGNNYTYDPEDKLYDVYDLQDKTVQEYLDEDPDNFCFVMKSNGKYLYGITKIDKIREAVNFENIYNNDVFYGCRDVMETYLTDYLWSADPDKQQIAMDNVDTRFIFTYLQKFAVLNAFVYNPALEGLLTYPGITHRCYFLEPNTNFSYGSVINKHLIDSTATDSTGTTHCGQIPTPIMYNIVPCFPSREGVSGKKRDRSPPSVEESLVKKRNLETVPDGPYISVNYREMVYHVEYTETTTIKNLKELFLDQLSEKGVIPKQENKENTIVMFVFLGKVYRTKGEDGETKFVKKDIVDKYPEYKQIVLVSNVKLPSVGGRPRPRSRPRARARNSKKHVINTGKMTRRI